MRQQWRWVIQPFAIGPAEAVLSVRGTLPYRFKRCKKKNKVARCSSRPFTSVTRNASAVWNWTTDWMLVDKCTHRIVVVVFCFLLRGADGFCFFVPIGCLFQKLC